MQNPYHPLSLGHKLSDFVVYKEFIKYMKKTKIIIPALGLLLLSTAASVSGTVAWFAMNASVDATGLKIQAKSDSVFLLISSTNSTASAIQAENNGAGFTSVNLNVSDQESQLLPSAHDTIATTTDAVDPTNWYYKVANSANSYASTGDEYPLDAENFAKYVIHKTVYVTLALGSNAASNLKVKSCTVAQLTNPAGAKVITPVKVLVTSATNKAEFGSTGVTNDTTVLAPSVTDSSVAQLDIFLYYNGEDTNVFTNNIANLDGATVSLTFDVNR